MISNDSIQASMSRPELKDFLQQELKASESTARWTPIEYDVKKSEFLYAIKQRQQNRCDAVAAYHWARPTNGCVIHMKCDNALAPGTPHGPETWAFCDIHKKEALQTVGKANMACAAKQQIHPSIGALIDSEFGDIDTFCARVKSVRPERLLAWTIIEAKLNAKKLAEEKDELAEEKEELKGTVERLTQEKAALERQLIERPEPRVDLTAELEQLKSENARLQNKLEQVELGIQAGLPVFANHISRP